MGGDEAQASRGTAQRQRNARTRRRRARRGDAGADTGANVEVRDNGIGLPANRDRIAEPYVTTRARGTGLGLAIVTKIVEEHFGTIAFDDTEGGGTRVTIRFDMTALASLDAGTAPASDDFPAELSRNRT